MSHTITFKDPLFGETLRKAVDNPLPKRPPIAEGFLYEKSSLMVASDPGCGKSCLALQAGLELSAGLPVFGYFPVSRPYKFYYIQKERPKEESLERIESMQSIIPWNPDNFVLDEELQGVNFASKDLTHLILERIRHFQPDIICIDPIYAGNPGLSTDEGASNFTTFLTILQKEIGCTNWLNHHTVKHKTYQNSAGDQVEKEDPFYGSQWLKAHVTGSYYVKATPGGVKFANKKDSHSNLLESFELSYDAESYISSMEANSLSYHDRFSTYLLSIKGQKKKVTFKEMKSFLGCADRTLRNLLCIPLFKDALISHKSNGKQTLYEVKN